MQTIAKFAPKFGAAMLTAVTLGTLLAGNFAYADTTHSWDQDHSGNQGGDWNHGGGDHDGWSSSGNWYRWHMVNGAWQSYFDWAAYCTWYETTYGVVVPACAAYVAQPLV